MAETGSTFLARKVMKDAAAELELSERGYTVVSLLDSDEVGLLHDFYVGSAASRELNPPGAYNETFAEFTTMNSHEDFREDAFRIVESVAVPRTAEHLIDYRPVVANFVNKPPGTGVVPVHQNMSVVDERVLRSVSVWIALVDCHAGNGTLEFIDGSHRTFRGRRGTWAYQEFSEVDHSVIEEHLTPVDIRAGQAIILDDAIIHYSPPNRSDQRRLAIQLVMAPVESEVLYFEQVDSDGELMQVDELSVDPSYFWHFWGGVGDRKRSPAAVLHRHSLPDERWTAESFRRRLGTEQAATSDALPTVGTVPPTATSSSADADCADAGRPANRHWWSRLVGRRSRT